MRSRTATWFETKIRYEKTIDDGSQKKVSESYVVDALSFTEAENTIIEEMSAYIHRPQSRNFQNYQHKNSYRQAEGLASQQ